MAQSKAAVAPDVLPPDFAQWDKGNPVMRFLKAAGQRYFGATLNAGPQQSSGSYGTPEWRQLESDMRAGKLKGGIQGTDYSPSGGAALSSLGDVASQLNPVSIDKFQSGDYAGGAGETAMNLLLLKKGFDAVRGNVAEFGSPRNFAEKVTPIDSYTKVTPQTLQAEALRRGGYSQPTMTSIDAARAANPQPKYNAPAPENPTFSYPEQRGLKINMGPKTPMTRPADPTLSVANTPEPRPITAFPLDRPLGTIGPERQLPAPVNRTASGNPQRSNLAKNQRQMAASEQGARAASKVDATPFQESSAQRMYGTSFENLTETQKVAAIQDAINVQQMTPRVPSSYEDMNLALRQSLSRLGKTY